MITRAKIRAAYPLDPGGPFLLEVAEGRCPIAVTILLAVARLLGRITHRHHYSLLAEALLAVDSPEARSWGDR